MTVTESQIDAYYNQYSNEHYEKRLRKEMEAITEAQVEALERQVMVKLMACVPQEIGRLNELEDNLKVIIKLITGIYKDLAQFNRRLTWCEEQIDGVENYLANTLKKIDKGSKNVGRQRSIRY